MPPPALDSIRLIQLTDCHLGRTAGTRLVGMDTDASLKAVIGLLTNVEADVVIASGDLAENGDPQAYKRLLPTLQALCPAVCWMPGNHDRREHLLPLIDPADFCPVWDVGGWRLICLDTQIPGEVGGELSEAELERLELALTSSDGRHTLIALHHQVLPVGCAWLDRQRVVNSDRFWQTVRRYPNVRVTLSGHVHQAWEGHWAGVRVLTSPSTCIQFRPASSNFALDTLAPGYRWLELGADGSLRTGVERATDFTVELDLDATGY